MDEHALKQLPQGSEVAPPIIRGSRSQIICSQTWFTKRGLSMLIPTPLTPETPVTPSDSELCSLFLLPLEPLLELDPLDSADCDRRKLTGCSTAEASPPPLLRCR
mmetsp:Transcript_34795/g.47276  ORF Transcript_34795/g.47276 Transcript_34795/m.47276 type:complete len:105 (+) Transcript_34795:325-639(+)